MTLTEVIAKLETRLSILEHAVLPRSMEFTVPHNAQVAFLKEMIVEFKALKKSSESIFSAMDLENLKEWKGETLDWAESLPEDGEETAS